MGLLLEKLKGRLKQIQDDLPLGNTIRVKDRVGQKTEDVLVARLVLAKRAQHEGGRVEKRNFQIQTVLAARLCSA